MIRNDGFTLIEVLVAFVIVSMTVLAGLQLFSGGLARISRIEEKRHELETAQSLVASHDDNVNLPAGWRVVIGRRLDAPVSWTPIEPHLVQVIHTVDGVDHVVLESIELRSKP